MYRVIVTLKIWWNKFVHLQLDSCAPVVNPAADLPADDNVTLARFASTFQDVYTADLLQANNIPFVT